MFDAACFCQWADYDTPELCSSLGSPWSTRLADPHKPVKLVRGWVLAAFREGVEATKRRQPISANPYQPRSDAAVIWESGWKEGQTL